MTLIRTKWNLMAVCALPLLLALATLPATAQEAMGLKAILQQALEHNTNVRKAAMDQEAARYKVNETRAEGLPQISAQADLNYYPSIATQILPGEIIGKPGTQVPVQFGTKYNATLGGKVTQMLYDQRFLTGLQAARRSAELYEMLQLQTEEQVIHEVASAYYQVLDLEAQQASVDSQLVSMVELERITTLQVENQFKRKLDLQRVQVNRQNATTQRDGYALNVEQQVNYLKLLMGMPASAELVLAHPDNMGVGAPVLSTEARSAQRTDIKVLQQQIELQDLNIRSIRAGYMPTLSAFGSLNYQAQRNEFNFFDQRLNWFPNSVIGGTLAIPLFDGFRKHSQIAQQKVVLLQYEADLEYTTNALAVEERNAIAALDNSWRTVEAQASNLVLAQDVYSQTNDLYSEGIAPLTDLLDADQALSDSRTAYHSATLKYKLAELDLLKAQGGLKTLTQ
ncbi:MAG: TolC family protein [Flavobacteriales bacterium]